MAPRADDPPARPIGELVSEVWPLWGIRLTTPRLELRPVDTELAFRLGELALEGIHDPRTMPFTVPWTDEPDPLALQRSSVKFYLRVWSDLTAGAWQLPFAVFERERHAGGGRGRLVGMQDLLGKDFGETGVVETGSWLASANQGRGIGREMRAVVLHLAFELLGAQRAESAAWDDNPASAAVSRAVGYEPNGDRIVARRGLPTLQLRFVLTRATWRTRPPVDVEVVGLTRACLDQLGIPE